MEEESGVGLDDDNDVEVIERPDASYQVMWSLRGFAPWMLSGRGLGELLFSLFVYVPYQWIFGSRRGCVVAVYRLPRFFGFPRPVAMRLVSSETEAQQLTDEWIDGCKRGRFDAAPTTSWWSRRRLLGVDKVAVLALVSACALIAVACGLLGLLTSLPDQLS